MNDQIASINVLDLEGAAKDLMTLYKNKAQLLIIYNNDCIGCTGRAIPLAFEFQQNFPTLQVAGIHSNFLNRAADKDAIKSIFTSGENPFPIYIDKDHKVFDQFNAEGTPQWLLISKNGTLFRSVFGSQENAKNRLFYAIEHLLETDSHF